MKRVGVWVGVVLAGCVAAGIVLMWPVSIRQGVNYEVSEIRMPLFAKAIHFMSRALTLRQLARDITRGTHTDQEKCEAILAWMTRPTLSSCARATAPWSSVIR